MQIRGRENLGIPQELNEALQRFRAKADEILRSVFEPVDTKPPPSAIYHYTSDAGLRGILESGQLWLSDIFSMNDPSELRHGMSPAVEILKARARADRREQKLFADDFSNFSELSIEATAHYFVCSFSSDSEELGQWRAYADNGRGYVLGFDGKELEDAFIGSSTTPNPTTRLLRSTFRVNYDDAELSKIHGKLIDAMFDLISLPRGRKDLDSDSINEYTRALSIYTSQYVLSTAIFFKHEAYRHESEFRFQELHEVSGSPPDVKRRYRSHQMVKYREFDWRSRQPRALREIVVGPAADRDKALQFARDCLASFGYKHVTVRQSQIPYRVIQY